MEEKNYSGTIPSQEDGSKINVESSIDLKNVELAKSLYETAKNRLFDVNNWQKLTGKFLANFQLTDQSGNPEDSPVRQGMYFQIDIPGPGSKAGEGYDWVKVEKIEVYNSPDIESVGIRVRPAPNPLSTNENIAHFYSGEATSTFTVTREMTKITAAVYDRNTKPNQDTDQLSDQLRNAIIGISGIISFSRIQWKTLTDALIKQDE
ncbi:hypothetical protein [Dyadobacter frigoris]|uniref:Uncharacterized protein n=1 Tax=Dyadobacter frigoris TaxID=2576211 RepID=A0A4U6D346_9BACT|nr:hypothetical protein [Dyadobacter frigoris]TKT90765.1 hypothetical protein FDK13_17510 [Dyadobacter frigoris]GLU52099.1 hypothetical protein Dfri01_15600 [Dyadobacter frigoris]